MEQRPSYCDRGHWKVCCEIADLIELDGADRFPRYFMSAKVAMKEMEQWLAWRLWKVRHPDYWIELNDYGNRQDMAAILKAMKDA